MEATTIDWIATLGTPLALLCRRVSLRRGFEALRVDFVIDVTTSVKGIINLLIKHILQFADLVGAAIVLCTVIFD